MDDRTPTGRDAPATGRPGPSGPAPVARGEEVAPAWHALAAADVVARLGTDPDRGLDDEAAAARLRDVGPNRLPEK
ncbi:MAG: hypothetical protein H5T83_05640, partial [Actinotalea sp.]|nr:hypothetical protein [Actinotalea sp.]